MASVEIPAQGVIAPLQLKLAPFGRDGGSTRSVFAYLGIPFAQAPVGPLRWKRPQKPAPSWSPSIRQSAWQPDSIQDIYLRGSLMKDRYEKGTKAEDILSEDCLYLNIWVPEGVSKGSKVPVLTWVYGGSFVSGAASQPTYDGARLSNETGCIVIGLSYRVGVLGWIASRSLAEEAEGGSAGNYGLWDTIAGFEWIQENVETFGGDKDNVCAFGESAGSIILHYLLLCPLVPPNLFARAILESGTAVTVLPRTMPSQQATFDAIAEKVGASDTMSEKERLELMRKASPFDLMKAASTLITRRPRTEYFIGETQSRPLYRSQADPAKLSLEPMSLFGPTWDGHLISKDFLHLATSGLPRDGKFNNAQKGILLGYCMDEGTLFNVTIQSPKQLHDHVRGYHPDLEGRIRKLYGVDGVQTNSQGFEVCAAYTGDALFQAPVRSLMHSLGTADQQNTPPSYGFIFAHKPSSSAMRGIATFGGFELTKILGVLHTAEIGFVFGCDGTERHIFYRSDYSSTPKDVEVIADEDEGDEGDEEDGQLGFTAPEKKLSRFMMDRWGQFAHGKDQIWSPLRSMSEETEDLAELNIMEMGAVAQKGAHSLVAEDALRRDNEQVIPIKEKKLGDTLDWSEVVHEELQSSTTAAKQQFWTGNNFEMLKLQYYGDADQQWVP